MSLAPLRWLGKNVSALLLAFLLAMVVWVSAVIVDDPNIERPLARPVPIEFIGKDANLKLMGEYPTTVNLVLLAPQSVWKRLDNEKDSIRAWVDLSNLGAGEVDVPVRVHINLKLVRQISQDPEHLHLLLEPVISEIFPVVLAVNGEPPIGYKASPVQMDPAQVTVSGPASLVGKVKEVRASLDIAGAVETLIKIVAVSALDASGRTVSGVNVNPSSVTVTQGISLLGGYRNVIVKVNTTGIVASGYRLTNYLPSPSSIIVFSSDPQLVSALPGYI